jgi:hypothetical protein
MAVHLHDTRSTTTYGASRSCQRRATTIGVDPAPEPANDSGSRSASVTWHRRGAAYKRRTHGHTAARTTPGLATCTTNNVTRSSHHSRTRHGVLDEDTCLWQATVPYPDDGGMHHGTRTTQTWEPVEP